MAERPTRIEGFAIVSEDGMLANAQREMPDALKFEADQKFFRDGLDRCDAVVHGRHSHEQQPNSSRRHRIWVTGRVADIAHDPADPKVLLWNPAGATFEQAWAALGVDGWLGVVGGPVVFGMFLPRYDVFHLTRAPGVKLPGGRPVFPGVPAQTPEQVMAKAGLHEGETHVLDEANNLIVTAWLRGAARDRKN
jgi:hypothetical protein